MLDNLSLGVERFVIDDGYRRNLAHIAPVYGERMFGMLASEDPDADDDRA